MQLQPVEKCWLDAKDPISYDPELRRNMTILRENLRARFNSLPSRGKVWRSAWRKMGEHLRSYEAQATTNLGELVLLGYRDVPLDDGVAGGNTGCRLRRDMDAVVTAQAVDNVIALLEVLTFDDMEEPAAPAVTGVVAPVAAQMGGVVAHQSRTEAELNRLKIPQLKVLLRERKLKVGGKKAELVARLVAADATQ